MAVNRLTGVTWVAHRGHPSLFPENSLIGYQSAVDCGAKFVELDVQLTADAVPILHHDASLLRMSGIDQDIFDIHADDLGTYPAACPKQFGDRFAANRLSTLAEFAEWLSDQPGVVAFVEVKAESVRHFGGGPVVDSVYEHIRPVLSQCVIISFEDSVLERVRQRELSRYGWVLPGWGSDIERRARELQPEFLFSSIDLLPERADELWTGPWNWVIYNIDDRKTALRMSDMGLNWLETNRIGRMIAESLNS